MSAEIIPWVIAVLIVARFLGWFDREVVPRALRGIEPVESTPSEHETTDGCC